MTSKDSVRILVVDDEAGMRDMLALELRGRGYQVSLAENGDEALALVRRQRFDLVVTDMQMPGMDGNMLLEQIKKIEPRLEVIIMTGYGTVEVAVTAMKNGAFDFILKPFHLEELNAKIEKALEKKDLKMLVALYEASNVIFSTIELDKLLKIILEMLQNVLGADEGSIMLLDESRKLRIAASHSIDGEEARLVRLEIGDRVAGLVAKEKHGRLFVGGLEKYDEFKGIASKAGIHSSIVCPLLCQDRLLGVLTLNKTGKGENFTLADLQSASVFASQAALAIQNAKLYANLQDAYKKLEQAQEDLIRSEKLASIGRLVAGVAHELNNPLTSVIGYSQLAQDTSDLKEIRRQLPIIYTEARRCSSIVKDLLLFARRHKPDYQAVDSVVLIREILKSMSLDLQKKKIAVQENFSSSSMMIEADPHLLKQVFANILTNAHQALEEVQRQRRMEIAARQENGSVIFSIKDNGPGIPQENLRRIFDPFYTTKEVGKGTGLGLSLSYGIVKEHAGKLTVESQPGKETVFIIELPLKSREGLPAPAPKKAEPGGLRIPKETRVLLVEDEPAIRKLIRRLLSEGGVSPEEAADGEAALGKIREGRYDLILCDYRMPKLNGVNFFEEAIRLKPELAGHFLFITGSTEFMHNFETFFKENSLNCLNKPFTRDEFISLVNRMMEKGKNGHDGRKAA